MTTPTTGTIYGLVDPRTYEVKYVGQTVKPIEERLAGHLAAPAPLVRAWIESLVMDGHSPEIIPIRGKVPVAELDAAEKEEIKAHAERGDLLNTAGNGPGNAKRRKISREEKKRRDAQEEAMRTKWERASWRKVADQIRDATGGPLSPEDIPVRPIPAAVWETYLTYRAADQELTEARATRLLVEPRLVGMLQGLRTGGEETEALFRTRESDAAVLEKYMGAYCAAFSAADDGDRWGSDAGVFGRGDRSLKVDFRDAAHMARYLSLIPWAARAMDPWVALAKKAGMSPKDQEFVEWVSEDRSTREAVDLYRVASPAWLGVFRQSWDAKHATYMLALGAAHIPGFVTPESLTDTLKDALTEMARERQTTRSMCQLLERIDPGALDTVYGRDELAESDKILGLPPGTSAKVIRKIYGGDSRDPGDRAAKLIQRHAGAFDAVAIPDYSGWSGPHIPGFRSVAASFYGAGLLSDADPADGEALSERVKDTWKPTRHGLKGLEELEKALLGAAQYSIADEGASA